MQVDTGPSATGTSRDVLVVDDDPSVADLLETYLQRHGRVEAVAVETDPRDALGRFDGAGTFDCLVCDFDMPAMNGLELLERVRAEYGPVQFVLFTGAEADAIEESAALEGVDAVIRKRSAGGGFEAVVEAVVAPA